MYLGIDIGTQSLKVVIADADLRPLGMGRVPYRPSYPRPGWAEQDPTLWLSALRPAIGAALASAHVAPSDIKALAICGQLDGCIGVTRDGDAVAPAIIWMDRRASAETADVDPALVRERAGLVLDATHMAAKIRWSRRHIDRAADVAVWHQPVSFIVEALTGNRVMDHSLASTTMLYGLAARTWDASLLTAFGIDPATLPLLADAHSIAGGLSEKGARLTGLEIGIPVAVGTGDDFSNPLGCGITEPGTVSVTLGTGEAISALSEQLVIDAEMLVETHAFPGGYFHIGNPGWLSGGAISWFLTTFSVASAAEFSALAASVPPGSDGLLFLPALSGAMAPRWVSAARGAFYGITATHSKSHFARAILEGTSFAMHDVLDRLDVLGVPTGRIRIMGGGGASDVWTQIRADLTGKRIETLQEGDASAMGALVLAVAAAGEAPDIRSASQRLHLSLAGMEPIIGNRSIYEDSYRRYRDLFAALEPLFG
ncbi:MAG: FGGY family carbohydrate kinase [Devosia sp.]|nr:FGGY family carbohydrate kinase [Devosia sp.]